MKSPLRRRRKAAALVVTLSLIVIITVLVLAFFANSTMNQQLENSSTDRIDTELLARSAIEVIVSDLKQEMLAGSMDVSVTGDTLRPKSGAEMIQERVLVDPAMSTNTAFDTLIKQSAEGRPMFTNNANSALPKITGASSVNTMTPARNNRRIGIQRWNAPMLVREVFQASQAPSWVYLGEDGITNVTTGNVVGRFAFNIYNVGGLLNINVAGSPNTLTTAQKLAIKGTPAGATLENIIPGILDAQELIEWRNAQSGLTATAYVDSILNATNGFREPASGDNRFVSRQDLIRFTRQHPAVLATNALPYLTTFSLERNLPSWGPMTNAPAAAFAYLSNSTNGVSTNRLFTMAKYSAGGPIVPYDPNGNALPAYTVQVGDPVIRRRFSLDRLRWITADGPAVGVSAAAIRAAFGLEWNAADDCWTYSSAYLQGTNPGRIATLAEVASAGREPTFFELLKAAILSGSLGKEAGNGLSSNGAYDGRTDYQVIQIGCNIIDQYRGDDFPTRVRFDATSTGMFAGVVDLPYLNRLASILFRPEVGQPVGSYGLQATNRAIMGAWLVPEFWSPHARSVFSSNAAPANIRVRIDGATFTVGTQATTMSPPAVDKVFTDQRVSIPGLLADQFRQYPDVVRTAMFTNATTTDAYGTIRDTGGYENVLGLNVAFINAYTPTNRGFLVANRNEAMRGGGISPKTLVRIDVEVERPTRWVAYDTIKTYSTNSTANKGLRLVPNNTSSGYGTNSPDIVNMYALPVDLLPAVRGATAFVGDALLKPVPVNSVARSDPRTDRFGLSPFAATQMGFLRAQESTEVTGRYYDPKTLPRATQYEPAGYNRAAGGLRAYQEGSGQFSAAGWYNGNNLSASYFPGNYPGALTDNKANSTPGSVYYTDNDGVQRRALGAYATFLMNQTDRTPVMLNRRFFTVGDLGYVHRGEPWKNLDFFTAQSADAGLLDVFTTSDFGSITEGKVDLNSAPAAVLQAYLAGTVMNEAMTNGTLIGPGSVATVADKIRDEVRARPMINKAELVTRFDDNSSLRSALELDKARHETYIRGLADIAQTRTWNLMIDVIVQKGMIAKTSTDLKDFLVEGERRYWLHIAIDRFTGEVVDRRLEAVYE